MTSVETTRVAVASARGNGSQSLTRHSSSRAGVSARRSRVLAIFSASMSAMMMRAPRMAQK
jgi:hypothetical protein